MSELPDPQEAIEINVDVSAQDQTHAIALDKLRAAKDSSWLLILESEVEDGPSCARIWSSTSPEFLMLAFDALRYAILQTSLKAWKWASEKEESS